MPLAQPNADQRQAAPALIQQYDPKPFWRSWSTLATWLFPSLSANASTHASPPPLADPSVSPENAASSTPIAWPEPSRQFTDRIDPDLYYAFFFPPY